MKPFLPTLDQAQNAMEMAGHNPVYLTNQAHLDYKVNLLKSAFDGRAKIFYAVKANYNPTLVTALKSAGINGLDTVSPNEILLGQKLGFTADEMLFTGNSCSTAEMDFVHNQGVILNIGSLSELRRFGENHEGAECALRLNVDVGAGECDFVVTGGEDTKFGISDKDLEQAKKIIADCDLNIIGIHAHIGSGFYEKHSFMAGVKAVLERASDFGKSLKFVDLGGGFGIRYSMDSAPIDIMDWGQAVIPLLDEFKSTQTNPEFHYRIEPGKFLVGESTCLLTNVTMIKGERNTVFIGTDTGFNHLIRPALYQSHHEIINISTGNNRPDQDGLTIVGNVCESGDIFAENITLPKPQEGDVLTLLSAGGYGQSMSAIYQLRSPATEIMIDNNGQLKITKAQKTFDELYDFIH